MENTTLLTQLRDIKTELETLYGSLGIGNRITYTQSSGVSGSFQLILDGPDFVRLLSIFKSLTVTLDLEFLYALAAQVPWLLSEFNFYLKLTGRIDENQELGVVAPDD